MKITKDQVVIPNLTGGRSFQIVEVSALKGVREAFVSQALNEGDEIEFGDTAADMHVAMQEVAKGGAKASMVFANVNGKGQWVSIGSLCRRDIHFNPIGQVSADLWDSKYADDSERVLALIGRKVKVEAKAPFEMPTFADGKRIGTETKEVSPMKWA